MKKIIQSINLVLASTLLSSIVACSSSNNSAMLIPLEEINVQNTTKDITTRVKLDTPPFITQQKQELSSVAMMDDGKIYKYQTIKTDQGKVTATTFVYMKKWEVLESHPTTVVEAETILKLVRQGGHVKEYQALNERYETIGLVGLKKK